MQRKFEGQASTLERSLVLRVRTGLESVADSLTVVGGATAPRAKTVVNAAVANVEALRGRLVKSKPLSRKYVSDALHRAIRGIEGAPDFQKVAKIVPYSIAPVGRETPSLALPRSPMLVDAVAALRHYVEDHFNAPPPLNVVTSLLLLGVLYAYDVLLASAVLASIALQLLISQACYGELKGRREAQLAAAGTEQNHILESLRTIKAIRVFGHEAAREGQWSNLFVAVLNRTASTEQLRIVLAFSETVIFGVQSAVVIYLAGMRLLVSGDFTVGMLVSFLFYRQYLVDCAKTAIQNVTNLRLLRLHLDRLSHVLLEAEDPSLSTGAADELGSLADVEFRDVRFRYGGADTDTLFDINLKIKAGEFVAFVGPTGGGKSTLAKLLLGLYQPTRGEILIGDQPMNRVGAREWRRNVGAVLQEDTLLAGSIADNISFFDADLDLERVQAVAKMARVHEDIERLPMKYWTLVGDLGSTLSAGQRQRMLLARALYNGPDVLVLDEGTANLDEETEREIVRCLEGLPLTRIVISHRPAPVESAHRVFKIERGFLTELRDDVPQHAA